jgi:hypothetical protein
MSFDGKMPVKEFSLEDMYDDVCILIIAKRGSGKSWITRAILHKLAEKKYPSGIIISPTENKSPFYIDFFPDTFIHYDYNPQLIKKVLVHQMLMKDKQEEKRNKGQKIKGGIKCFIVMDDCLASAKKWIRCDHMREIMMNGRHSELTFILTMQYPLGIPPNLRTNFDYVFLLKEEAENNLKKYYSNYASIFPNIHVFKKIFAEVTSNFSAMVLINKGRTETIFDKFAFYKAPNLENKKIKMLSKQYRVFHKMNYDTKWREKVNNQFINDVMGQLTDKNSKVSIKRVYNGQN